MNKTDKYSNNFEWSSWRETNNCQNGFCTHRRHCDTCSGSSCFTCTQLEKKCKKCRQYNNGSCVDQRPCFETKADNYRYTNWSPWTPCSQTCGIGRRIRSRKCQCKGISCFCGDEKLEQSEKCKVQNCEDYESFDEIVDDCIAFPPGMIPHNII